MKSELGLAAAKMAVHSVPHLHLQKPILTISRHTFHPSHFFILFTILTIQYLAILTILTNSRHTFNPSHPIFQTHLHLSLHSRQFWLVAGMMVKNVKVVTEGLLRHQGDVRFPIDNI